MDNRKNGRAPALGEAGTASEEAVIRELLHVQRKELEVRERETELKRSELEHNKELAKKSIDAQLEDSQMKFKYFSGQQKNRFILSVLSLACFTGFMFFAMFNGNTDFAYDVLKLAAGGVAGYFVGRNQQSAPNNQKNED